MRARGLAALVVTILALALPPHLPAQTAPRRVVIEMTTTSYKYDPNVIRIHEGDTVVIRIRNIDPFGRAHNFSSTYLLNIPVTVRGDATQGTSEGRKWIALDAGKSAEFEFVAQGRGSFAILCSLFDHAARGHTGMLFVGPAGSP
jgi:plastocyanin